MNKLQKACTIALSGMIVLTGLSPAWGQRRPKRIKKGHKIEGTVERRTTLGELRRTRRLERRSPIRKNKSVSTVPQNTHVTPREVTRVTTVGNQVHTPTVTNNAHTGTSHTPTQAELQAQVQQRIETEVGNQIRNSSMPRTSVTPAASTQGKTPIVVDEQLPLSTGSPANLEATMAKWEQKIKASNQAQSSLEAAQAALGKNDLMQAYKSAQDAVANAQEAGEIAGELSTYQAVLDQVKKRLTQQISDARELVNSTPAAVVDYAEKALKQANELGLTGTEITGLQNLLKQAREMQELLIESSKLTLQELDWDIVDGKFDQAIEAANDAIIDLRRAGVNGKELAPFANKVRQIRGDATAKAMADTNLHMAQTELMATGEDFDPVAAMEYAQDAYQAAQEAGLIGKALAPYEEVLKQAKSRSNAKELAEGYLHYVTEELSLNPEIFDYEYALEQATKALDYAEEAGLTGEALAPYQDALTQVVDVAKGKAEKYLKMSQWAAQSDNVSGAISSAEKAMKYDQDAGLFAEELAPYQEALNQAKALAK